METSKIIKRLELILNFISLEDENDINEQIQKIEQFQLNDSLIEIIAFLKNKEFNKAVNCINKFINSYKQLVVFQDPEIEALRLEAKLIEFEIQELSNEKAELEKYIHLFDVKHSLELGDLILKILAFRKEKFKFTDQKVETENDYNEFKSNFNEKKDIKIQTLNQDLSKELKDKYRKASKLCHPDMVAEEFKEKANEIFTALKLAYEANDLKKVSEILEKLENGTAFQTKADLINNKEYLLVEIERLRTLLKELKNDVEEIKSSDTYIKISSIENWDEYFNQTKIQLQEQLNHLENGK